MPSSHLILCHPLLLLPLIPPSIRVFSNESTLHMRWPKYWSFSFSILPSKEHPGLISFRMDGLDLLAAQGTLKSLLQHHSSKASILQLQSYPIFCNPVNCSLPGSSIHGILQTRILEWVSCPPPGDLPDPGTEPELPMSPALSGRVFTTSATWEDCVKL